MFLYHSAVAYLLPIFCVHIFLLVMISSSAISLLVMTNILCIVRQVFYDTTQWNYFHHMYRDWYKLMMLFQHCLKQIRNDTYIIDWNKGYWYLDDGGFVFEVVLKGAHLTWKRCFYQILILSNKPSTIFSTIEGNIIKPINPIKTVHTMYCNNIWEQSTFTNSIICNRIVRQR